MPDKKKVETNKRKIRSAVVRKTRKPSGVPPGTSLVDRPHPNRLREIRLKGTVLSQDRIAKLMDCDASTVSREESGMSSLSKDRIVAYASLYGISTFEIFLDLPATGEASDG